MRIAAALVCVLACLDCGGGSGGGNGSLDTYRDYQKALNALDCSTRFRCCTPDQAMSRYPNKPDAVSCAAALNADLAANMIEMKLEAAIADGTLRFDTNSATACVASARAAVLACDGQADLFATSTVACQAVLIGAIGAGSDCNPGGASTVCPPRSFCQGRTCVPTLHEGAMCTFSASCDPGLACRPSGLCGAPLELGQPCMPGYQQCRSGLCEGVCAPQTVTQLICG